MDLSRASDFSEKGYANAKGAETKVFSEVFCQALPIVQAAFKALNQGALSYL